MGIMMPKGKAAETHRENQLNWAIVERSLSVSISVCISVSVSVTGQRRMWRKIVESEYNNRKE